MAVILDARVRQKKDTEANWLANPLILLDGEQAFVVGSLGIPINFKIGDGTKTFAQLPYWITYGNVPTSVNAAYSFAGKPAGVFLPTANGTYNGTQTVDLSAGLTYLVWDGAALSKIVYPISLSGYTTVASVVNNLTTGGTTVPLSAEQGKVLKALIDTVGGSKIPVIENALFPKALYGASDTLSTYISIVNSTGTRGNNNFFTEDSIIDSINLWAVTAGTVVFKVLERDTAGYLVTSEFSLTVVLGLNTFLPVTNYPAFSVKKYGNVSFYMDASTSGKIGYKAKAASGLSATVTNHPIGTSSPYSVSGSQWGIIFNVSTKTLPDKVTTLESDSLQRKSITLSTNDVNLFSTGTIVNDSVVKKDGTTGAQVGWKYIEVPLLSGQTIVYVGGIKMRPFFPIVSTGDGSGYWKFDVPLVAGVTYGAFQSEDEFSVNVPSGATKFLIDIRSILELDDFGWVGRAWVSDKPHPKINYLDGYKVGAPYYNPHSRLIDKTLLIDGDSISNLFGTTMGYQTYSKEWTGIRTVITKAVNGSGLVKPGSSGPGMVNRVSTWPLASEIDFISIMGNMNDGTTSFSLNGTPYPSGLPIGTFADSADNKKEASVYGALHWLFKHIQTNYPLTPVVFIISTPRLYIPAIQGKCWGVDGWFEAWTVAIKTVCGHYSIPCLDLYHNSGLKPWIAANRAAFFSGVLEGSDTNGNVAGSPGDGIHPNEAGQKLIAYKVYDFWNQYL